MKSYKVLTVRHNLFAIMLDPRAYEFSSFNGEPSTNSFLSFSTNHSLFGKQFGLSKCGLDSDLEVGLQRAYQYRPCLCITASGLAKITAPRTRFWKPESYRFICQAGPTLLKYGQIQLGDVKEKFRDNYEKVEPIISCGVTKTGKLVVAWSNDHSLCELLDLFDTEFDCISAMKLASGKQAFLEINNGTTRVRKGNQTAFGVELKWTGTK